MSSPIPWFRSLGWIALGVLALALVAMASARSWDGPWGPLPGGRFRGPEEACPVAAWRDFESVEELQVEVRPERPRSVTTWSVVHDGTLFLPADFLTPGKRWPHQVMADPRVRVRVGARVFRCRAKRVYDEAMTEALRAAAARKYNLDPGGLAARSEVWWFRIEAR